MGLAALLGVDKFVTNADHAEGVVADEALLGADKGCVSGMMKL